ncbi:hypothetical protein EJB05_04210, partial [Eragrostis curvula]
MRLPDTSAVADDPEDGNVVRVTASTAPTTAPSRGTSTSCSSRRPSRLLTSRPMRRPRSAATCSASPRSTGRSRAPPTRCGRSPHDRDDQEDLAVCAHRWRSGSTVARAPQLIFNAGNSGIDSSAPQWLRLPDGRPAYSPALPTKLKFWSREQGAQINLMQPCPRFPEAPSVTFDVLADDDGLPCVQAEPHEPDRVHPEEHRAAPLAKPLEPDLPEPSRPVDLPANLSLAEHRLPDPPLRRPSRHGHHFTFRHDNAELPVHSGDLHGASLHVCAFNIRIARRHLDRRGLRRVVGVQSEDEHLLFLDGGSHLSVADPVDGAPDDGRRVVQDQLLDATTTFVFRRRLGYTNSAPLADAAR